MKTLTMLTFFFVLTLPAISAEDKNVVYADVNGLVCDFCAQALEKVFSKKEEINSINVDLDTKVITIKFNDGKNLDDTTLTSLIVDSGYDVRAIRHE